MKAWLHRCYALGCDVPCPIDVPLCAWHDALAPRGLVRAVEMARTELRRAGGTPYLWVITLLDLSIAIAEAEGKPCARERWARAHAAYLATTLEPEA